MTVLAQPSVCALLLIDFLFSYIFSLCLILNPNISSVQ